MRANVLEGMMKAFRLVLHGSLRGIIFDRRTKWRSGSSVESQHQAD